MKNRYISNIRMTAAIGLAALLYATIAPADPPPSPDQDTGCGGNCQAVCINGCDSNTSYSWQQAACVNNALSDSFGSYCNDGYVCSFGACGRPNERACNTAATGCSGCAAGFAYDAAKAYCVVQNANPGNHPTWMKDLASSLANKQLNQVVFPGTHDAGMYNAVGLAKTQNQSFPQQLQGGVREFDIRPGILFGKQVIHHGIDYTGPAVQDVLNDFKNFLATAAGEVVILHFSHFAGEGSQNPAPAYTAQNYADFTAMVDNTLGPYLVSHRTLTPTSKFSAFVSPTHGSAIVICESGITKYWTDSVYTFTVYGDTTNQAFMKTKLNNAAFRTTQGGLTHLGTELTPYPDNATDNTHKIWFPSWLAQDGSPVIQRWIAQEWSNYAFNEISADFYEQTCLVPIAIWFNSGKVGAIQGCYAWPTSNQAGWDTKVWPY